MKHFVSKVSIYPPFSKNTDSILFGLGCFWGAEYRFWQLPSVYVTAVGYAGGHISNPTYRQVCSGTTGHIEVVLVVYQKGKDTLNELLKVFWQSNDPTQGMQSGNDIGEQYQSAIFCNYQEQYQSAIETRDAYQCILKETGRGIITTRIEMAPKFYYAEEYHQQYIAKQSL